MKEYYLKLLKKGELDCPRAKKANTDDDSKIYQTIKKCVRELKSVLVEGSATKNAYYGDYRESRKDQYERKNYSGYDRRRSHSGKRYESGNRNHARSLSRQRSKSRGRYSQGKEWKSPQKSDWKSPQRSDWKSPQRSNWKSPQGNEWKSPEKKTYFCDIGDVFLTQNNQKSETVNMGIIDCGCPSNVMGRPWLELYESTLDGKLLKRLAFI